MLCKPNRFLSQDRQIFPYPPSLLVWVIFTFSVYGGMGLLKYSVGFFIYSHILCYAPFFGDIRCFLAFFKKGYYLVIGWWRVGEWIKGGWIIFLYMVSFFSWQVKIRTLFYCLTDNPFKKKTKRRMIRRRTAPCSGAIKLALDGVFFLLFFIFSFFGVV